MHIYLINVINTVLTLGMQYYNYTPKEFFRQTFMSFYMSIIGQCYLFMESGIIVTQNILF